MRKKAPLKWSLCDGYEIFIYSYLEEIRTDITRSTERKNMSISLKPNQFTTLFHISRMLSAAINDFKYISYNLGNLIYVTHELFRNIWTINIRQYFIDDNGDEKPTRTGINITHHTWMHEIVPILSDISKYSFKQLY